MSLKKLQEQLERAVEALDRLREGQEFVLMALEQFDKAELNPCRIQLLLNVYWGWYEEPLHECDLALKSIEEEMKSSLEMLTLLEQEDVSNASKLRSKKEV